MNGCVLLIIILVLNFFGGVNVFNDNGFEEMINNDFCWWMIFLILVNFLICLKKFGYWMII